MRILPWALALTATALFAPRASAAWESVGPWGGSATSLAVDPGNPDTLLAGARNSLLYRSTDGGARWTRLRFPRHFLGTITTIAILPGEPRRYLAGVSANGSPFGGVWLSADAGTTWRQTLEGASTEALAVWARNPRTVVAGTRDGVWRSEDSGGSWQRISAPYNHELRGVTAVAIDPDDSAVIYAGTTHLPWKTTDGGKTWSSINDGMLDDSDVFSIFIDPARPGRILASACSGIYRSDSAGGKWTRFAGIPASHRRTHVIRQKPGKPEVIYAGTTLGLLKSTNGGQTFRQLNQLHILSMVFDPRDPERIILAAEGSGILVSRNGGESFEPAITGFVSRRVVAVATAGPRLYLNVVQDGSAGGIWSSLDGGHSWKLAASAGALGDSLMTLLAADPVDPFIVYAGNQGRLMRSLDSGVKWKPLVLPGRTAAATPQLQALLAIPAPGGRKGILLAGTSRGLFRSLDHGDTWAPVRLTQANILHSVEALHSSPLAPGRIAARTGQAVYLSEDSASTWRVWNILFPVQIINDIALTAGPILAATNQGLQLSEDGGRTWRKHEGGLATGTVSTLAVRPLAGGAEVYASQFGRLYRSRDAGRGWSLLDGQDLAEATVRGMLFAGADNILLLAITPDMGVFALDLSLLR